jgi:hypothetical protein
MNRQFALAISAALILLLAAGCVEKNEIDISEKMRMSAITGADIDSNGIEEVSLYEFAPLDLVPSDSSAGSVLVRKYVYAYPEEYSIAANGTDTASMKEYNEESKEYIANTADSCRVNINLCVSPESCKRNCGLAACTASAGNDIGYIMESMSDLIRIKETKAKELEQELSRNSSDQSKAARLMAESIMIDNAININPAVSKIGACPKTGTASKALPTSLEINVTKYRVIVVYNMVGSALRYPASVNLQDSIPADFSNKISLRDVMNSSTYSTDPNIQIQFKETDVNGSGSEYLTYGLESTAQNTQLTYVAMNKGHMEVTFYGAQDIYTEILLTVENVFFVPINGALGMPRLSIGLSVGAIYLIVMLAYQILLCAYAAARAARQNGDMVGSAREALGSANPGWVENAAIGAALLAAAWYMESRSLQPAGIISALDGRNIYDVVQIYDTMQLLGLAAYGMAAYMFADALVDRIKALAGGKYYSRNIMKYSASGVESGMKEIKEKIKKAYQEMGTYSDKGISTAEEYNRIAAISLDEANALFRKGSYREAAKLLDEYEKTISESILITKSKEKTVMINYAKWMDMVKGEIKESEGEKVNVDTLIEIPAEWRLWVVRKFIDENKEDGWALEGNTLKKIALPEQERIAGFMRTLAKNGKIAGGAVFNRTAYSGGYFGWGKESVNMAVSNRIVRLVLSLGQMLCKTKNNSFNSYGDACNIYVRGKNGISVMLVSEKRIDEEVDAMAEKAIRMVEKRWWAMWTRRMKQRKAMTLHR